MVPRNVTINYSRKRYENQRDYDESTKTFAQPLASSLLYTRKKKKNIYEKKISNRTKSSAKNISRSQH
jgi:hypothetical protein